MAVQRALAELDIAPGELREDQYAVSVLVQPEAGFMGVEGTDALVEVRLLLGDSELPAGLDFEEQYEDDEVEEEYAQPEAGSARLRELLTNLLDLLRVEAKIRILETSEALNEDITVDDMGILIGKRGQTIDALEYVATWPCTLIRPRASRCESMPRGIRSVAKPV